MIDQETGSLWSHLLGRAMAGPLQGHTLRPIPSVLTTWDEWKKRHPQTTVLAMSLTARQYNTRNYEQRGHSFVLGYAEGERAVAWRFSTLAERPIYEDRFGDIPVVVLYESATKTARLFDGRVDGEEIQLQLRDNQLMDRETGSTWNGTTGRATTGPLAGKQLTPLSGIVLFEQAWQAFHPKSEIR